MIDHVNHLSPRDFAIQLYRRYRRDAVTDSASQVAYYLFFSLFPLLFFLVTLTAFLPLERVARQAMNHLWEVLPANAARLVTTQLHDLVTRPRPRLLTISLVGALWSASRGVDAVRTALNLSYGVRETRAYWKTQVIALVVTILGAVLVLTSIAILVASGGVGFRLARWLGIERDYHQVASWLRWPLTAILVMGVADLSYYVLPDVRQRFRLITPGAMVATGLWLLATWGFGFYSSRWGDYELTYGSLGGVVVLLTWFLISAFAFLVGGEVNAIFTCAPLDPDEPPQRPGVPG